MDDWRIYKGSREPHDGIKRLPDPPPWRNFRRNFTGELPPIEIQMDGDDPYAERMLARGKTFIADKKVKDMVNAALYLRRPLLVSGKPGSGKTTLAYAVAHELKLGRVLRWSITTSTKLSDGLYTYDAMGHLQDTAIWKDTAPDQPPPAVGKYIRLGPLGAALLPSSKPRVLLVDEIDKGNINLPNDLLHIFEEGEFIIDELIRIAQDPKQKFVEVYSGQNSQAKVTIEEGHVRCYEFPFVVLTSNGEREFPPAFKRRCLPLTMPLPARDDLEKILVAHLESDTLSEDKIKQLFKKLEDEHGTDQERVTTQLLNALFLVSRDVNLHANEETLRAVIEPLRS